MSNNNNLRRNNSCQQYEPFMFGRGNGGADNSAFRTPQMVSVNTVSAPSQPCSMPMKTTSMITANASVRDCMQWPNSLTGNRNAYQPSQNSSYSSTPARNCGDFRYCAAPPKVYISGPGGRGKTQQNIPCQVAPLGTDPMSMIQPMQPLTVRVQAPADLFTGDPSQPKTISISPQQLYGGR